MCYNGEPHDLKVIYKNYVDWDEANVVRWCQECGAVVVDVEFDNRVSPGRRMEMKFPNKLKEVIKMLKENGRLKPADKEETAELLSKRFICTACKFEFSKRGTEFGETISCPQCKGQAKEKI